MANAEIACTVVPVVLEDGCLVDPQPGAGGVDVDQGLNLQALTVRGDEG